MLVPFPIAVTLYLAGSDSMEERLRWARGLGDTSPLWWKGIVGGDSIHWRLCGGWSVELLLATCHHQEGVRGGGRKKKEGREGGRGKRRERRGRRKKRKEEGEGGKKRRDEKEEGREGEETEHLG